jgi:hypothetical protein
MAFAIHGALIHLVLPPDSLLHILSSSPITFLTFELKLLLPIIKASSPAFLVFCILDDFPIDFDFSQIIFFCCGICNIIFKVMASGQEARDAATMRVIEELKRIYKQKIMPLEQTYRYDLCQSQFSFFFLPFNSSSC